MPGGGRSDGGGAKAPTPTGTTGCGGNPGGDSSWNVAGGGARSGRGGIGGASLAKALLSSAGGSGPAEDTDRVGCVDDGGGTNAGGTVSDGGSTSGVEALTGCIEVGDSGLTQDGSRGGAIFSSGIWVNFVGGGMLDGGAGFFGFGGPLGSPPL